jgi:hypothetical protein
MKWVSKLTILAFAVCVVAGSGIAFAKSPHVGRPAAPQGAGKVAPAVQQPAHISSIPKRYTVVNSGPLLAPNGVQTRGTATCPALTVIWGGGVFIQSSALGANVNSSFPNGNAWSGDVNNAGGFDTTFNVYAICAKQPGYSIQSATVTNFAGQQNTAQATCPGTSKILGGGGLSSSLSTAVNINSTIPVGKKAWRVDMNNATGSAFGATAYAVCGHAKARTTIIGSGVTNPAGQETFSSVSCPSPQIRAEEASSRPPAARRRT